MTDTLAEQTAFYQAKLTFEIDSYDLFAAISSGEKGIVIIDTRSKDDYEAERIPSALSFPHRTMDASSTGKLDRAVLYITYCDGIGCNGSTKGAFKLSGLGFRVKELIGGLEWWKRDGYATQGTNGQEGKELNCGC